MHETKCQPRVPGTGQRAVSHVTLDPKTGDPALLGAGDEEINKGPVFI